MISVNAYFELSSLSSQTVTSQNYGFFTFLAGNYEDNPFFYKGFLDFYRFFN